MRNIPPEILLLVFREYGYQIQIMPTITIVPLMRLSAVSRFWYETIHSSAELWADVQFAPASRPLFLSSALAILTNILQRSHQAPLHLELNMPSQHAFIYMTSTEFEDISPRLRSLSIHRPCIAGCTKFSTFFTRTKRIVMFPLLRTIDVDTTEFPDLFHLFHAAPLLNTFVLTELHPIRFNGMPWANIVDATFQGAVRSELVVVLEELRALEKLTLIGVVVGDGCVTSQVMLPRLREMKLSMEDIGICAYLILPSLESLLVSGVYFKPYAMSLVAVEHFSTRQGENE